MVLELRAAADAAGRDAAGAGSLVIAADTAAVVATPDVDPALDPAVDIGTGLAPADVRTDGPTLDDDTVAFVSVPGPGPEQHAGNEHTGPERAGPSG